MLRRLTILLGAAVLTLAVALPAASGHGKPPKEPQAQSPHALCMQTVAQSAQTFHQQQVDAWTAFVAQRKAAKKAFRAQQHAARRTFRAQHPDPTVADLKAFRDQRKAA